MKRAIGWCFLGVCAFLGGLVGVAVAPLIVSPVLAQPPSGLMRQPGQRRDQTRRPLRTGGPQGVAVGGRHRGQQVRRPPARPSRSRSPARASSSGWTAPARLLVLTNNHVVAGARPDKITVSLADGKLLRPGKVWADPEIGHRRAAAGRRRRPAHRRRWATATGVRVGQWVLAFGSPFGLNQTVTHGIISARERGQVSLGSTIRIKDFLQTDAAINPGSSGGPLVNLDGEVIGINTAIASHSGSNSGVAFSIPINLVKRVAQQLLENGQRSAAATSGLQLAADVRGRPTP